MRLRPRSRTRSTAAFTTAFAAGLLALAPPAHAAGPADLYTTISATGAPGTVTYRAFFGNAGPNRAAGTVTAVVQLPSQTTGASADLSDCAYDAAAKTFTCDLTGMPEGQGFILNVTAQIGPLAIGNLTAGTTVTGTDPDPDTGNNAAGVSCTALTGLVIVC
ncbi:hypothetical protein ACN20G_28715 (plasmid) [Streptomyces sp. BI20]|uniref:hypothetical protein n=1 Tax=Streptomyces sp. BI20 TaxID=3403460 RepID=UPI003C718C1B